MGGGASLWRKCGGSGNPLHRTDIDDLYQPGSPPTRISVTQATAQKSPLNPPVAPRRPHSFTTHGITVVDDYAWLKDKDWQVVLRDPSVLDGDIRNYLEA